MNIVVGGTHGLGWEIAKQLRERGEECFVIGRSYNQVDHGAGASLDLANRENVSQFISTHNKLLEGVDSFYWCAGIGYKGDFSAQEDLLKMIDVNISNILPLLQKVWQNMVSMNKGNIIVVSSSTGIKARTDEALYALTKHAQVGFARSLGLEAERLNINVHVRLVLPGGMQTPFWKGNLPDGYNGYNNPVKVAALILDGVYKQHNNFEEQIIERGEAV